MTTLYCVIHEGGSTIIGASTRTFYAALNDVNGYTTEVGTIRVQLPFVKTTYEGHSHAGLRLETREIA